MNTYGLLFLCLFGLIVAKVIYADDVDSIALKDANLDNNLPAVDTEGHENISARKTRQFGFPPPPPFAPGFGPGFRPGFGPGFGYGGGFGGTRVITRTRTRVVNRFGGFGGGFYG
ncbi:uncharacterized protein LOC119674106 [Teleopsis dalmanni]|uniref:uncharacterized protein LOC119674106 n=1 Tax=Teleopsis dalmanni TaxID=139649 RepID=UPI0018CFCC33|nr:uncharacterized protein LOC119674106 [Teleopsis dalmanni]